MNTQLLTLKDLSTRCHVNNSEMSTHNSGSDKGRRDEFLLVFNAVAGAIIPFCRKHLPLYVET